MKIRWTFQARNGLYKVIGYLKWEWSEKEIQNLQLKLEHLLKIIDKNIEIFPATEKFQNLRKVVVDKNNYIVYRFRPKKDLLEIIQFRGTRQKPL